VEFSFERHIEAHLLSHPLPIAMHCISIVFGGGGKTLTA
jgi:hypothetical protein